MDPDEVVGLKEIDRTEQIRTGYTVQRGQLQSMEVQWDLPAFFAEGQGEHSVTEQIRFCHEHLHRGGKLMGAFDSERRAQSIYVSATASASAVGFYTHHGYALASEPSRNCWP